MWSAIRSVAVRGSVAASATESGMLGPSTKAAAASVTMWKGRVVQGGLGGLGSRATYAFGGLQQQPARGFAVTALVRMPTATKTAKKTTKAKTTRKTAAKPKAKKVKVKAKKPKAKTLVKKPVKKAKKVLTPEAKKKLQVQALKKVALLKEEPGKLPVQPWVLFVTEHTKGTKTSGGPIDLQSIMPSLSKDFKVLSQIELQRLRDTAEKNRATNQAAYKAWVGSHEVASVARANRARQYLNRLTGTKHRAIQDDRLPKRSTSAFFFYTKARWETGQLSGQRAADALKILAAEWKALSPSERQAYEARADADFARYQQEVKTVLGRDVLRSPPASP